MNLKHLLKILYANQDIAKYGVKGQNYTMALIGATFYIFLTIFLALMILFAFFPKLFLLAINASSNINSIVFALILPAVIFLLLRSIIKEEDIKDSNFTNNYITKVMNFLIAYTIIVIMLIGVIGVLLLPPSEV